MNEMIAGGVIMGGLVISAMQYAALKDATKRAAVWEHTSRHISMLLAKQLETAAQLKTEPLPDTRTFRTAEDAKRWGFHHARLSDLNNTMQALVGAATDGIEATVR